MDDEVLLCEWQAAREAYDELLQKLFSPVGRERGQRPAARLLREATRRRDLEEASRRAYYASRGLDGI
ncbi:hypothetical protein [Intrasporangium sp. YIM S08009]|uniref:hypothetical protein n=1 Tax=Intrasporangium zincisolvens TaxID=3080018 RepID=UPI002B05B1ED|nr:hypothetical protein [Intrasporangium sp. YIM S08009]